MINTLVILLSKRTIPFCAAENQMEPNRNRTLRNGDRLQSMPVDAYGPIDANRLRWIAAIISPSHTLAQGEGEGGERAKGVFRSLPQCLPIYYCNALFVISLLHDILVKNGSIGSIGSFSRFLVFLIFLFIRAIRQSFRFYVIQCIIGFACDSCKT